MARSFAILALATAAQAALMPLPRQLTAAPGHLSIDATFSLTNFGCPEGALARFQSRLSGQTGATVVGGGPGLTVICHHPAPDYPAVGDDESYVLDIAPDGARLEAPGVTGVLRGLETFSQLLDNGQVPACHIKDRPRFPWRGLMLDVARHWMPPAVVMRNLDAMAAVKLNVFHWHLSDDQGFRVESKLYPNLHRAGSDGNFYTQDQIRQIVEYARDRAIRVVPEFDIPGHTTAWFAGMPELAAAPGPYFIERRFGVFPAVMAMDRETTYVFLDAFLGEMAALFPDPYFHIGGDEVENAQARALQPAFNRRVQEILRRHGKTMVGWGEILAPGLGTDAIVQSWRGPESLAAATAQGYRGILSFGYYLNYLEPAAAHYAVDPRGADRWPAHPAKAASPLPDGILGGEACMWAEYVDAQTVDSRIWPRMAAIAERFWSPADTLDVASMYARLESVSRWLEWTGIQHRANYLPMLERLAAGGPVEPLRVLADASEAGGHSVRGEGRRYTTLTPLDRFVDAVRPESELVRHLEQAAAARDFATLRAQFRIWAQNGTVAIVELQPLARNLVAVGEIGLQTLDILESNQTPPTAWLAQLDAMSPPIAEAFLAATRPVRMLLDNGHSLH